MSADYIPERDHDAAMAALARGLAEQDAADPQVFDARAGRWMRRSEQDATYEGWANRETWLVALWLNNDESLYVAAFEAASGGEDSMREWVESVVLGDEPAPNLATDLLTGALASVDWREVTQAFAPDPSVDCYECRGWSTVYLCQDDECGCSECERVRADRVGVPA